MNGELLLAWVETQEDSPYTMARVMNGNKYFVWPASGYLLFTYFRFLRKYISSAFIEPI